MDIFKPDVTLDGRWIDDFALCRFGVDVGLGVQQFDDVGSGAFSGGHVRYKSKNIASLSCTKRRSLTMDVSGREGLNRNKHTIRAMKNCNMVASRRDTSVAPHQKIKAMTKNT